MPKECALILKAKGRPYQGGRRRAVVLLVHDSKYVNLPEAFDELSEKAQSYLEDSFDHWTYGQEKANSRYHAYTEDGYKNCLHFRQNDFRFYGVRVHHPQDARFEICVLGTRVEKHEWKTNYVHLDRILKILEDVAFERALSRLAMELAV